MTWIRLDDRTAEHWKILALRDRELRTWLQMLCYASRQNHPALSVEAQKRLGITPAVRDHFLELRLLEPLDEPAGWVTIHDFRNYKGPTPDAERQRKHRRKGEETGK